MKRLTTIVLFAMLCGSAMAQTWFASSGTQSSTNVAYAVAPKGGKVTFISAYGEKLPRLEIWYTTYANMVTNALSAGLTNILVSTTNGLTDTGTVLIYDVSADTYQRARIMLPAAGSIIITNDLVAATTTSSLVAGDIVYALSQAGSFPITAGAAQTWTANGGSVWSAVNGPTLIQVKDLGTPTTNQMCIVSGYR